MDLRRDWLRFIYIAQIMYVILCLLCYIVCSYADEIQSRNVKRLFFF